MIVLNIFGVKKNTWLEFYFNSKTRYEACFSFKRFCTFDFGTETVF